MTTLSAFTIPALRGPVPLAHLLLRSCVHNGHNAIDATCGNGHDTLLLAQLVGTEGHVWGFDIQQQAIDITACKLGRMELSQRVTLLTTGHEELTQHLTEPVQVVLFNLGYLPGGDRNTITRPETTIAALNQSLQLLARGGLVIITVYPGHQGGLEEQSHVENWAAGLDPHGYYSWRMGQTNVAPTAPYLLLVQRTH